MAAPATSPKWISGVDPAAPLHEGARRALSARLTTLEDWLEKAGRKPTEKACHQLRVASRRADAAITAFNHLLDDDPRNTIARATSRLRKAAGRVRDCDARAHALADLRQGASAREEDALAHLIELLAKARGRGEKDLAKAHDKWGDRRLRDAADRLIITMHPPDHGGPQTFRQGAADAMTRALDAFQLHAAADLTQLDNLHQLRIAGKGLRYASEIFRVCLGDDFTTAVYPVLTRIQERLGRINDAHELRCWLVEEAGECDSAKLRTAIERLAAAQERSLATQRSDFLERWDDLRISALVEDVRLRLAADRPTPQPPASRLSRDVDAAIAEALRNGHRNGHHPAPAEAAAASPKPAAPAPPHIPPSRPETAAHSNGAATGACRLAAIDVGTNSIRLVIAEVAPDARYRIIDDEKAITRLGQGVDATSMLREDTMRASAEAIARMVALAQGYACRTIRAIATSAARDATNAPEFLALVRQQAGIELEVISAEHEARLALRSVQQAFDLSSSRAAVVDIGGGSTEIVLTASGLVEHVHPVQLGAVRLTDRFGPCEPDDPDAYHRMRTDIMRTLRASMGKPAFVPQIMFGTGGTFTNLAGLSMFTGLAPEPGAETLPVGVRGYQVRRSEVRHILDALRKRTVAERAEMPGLSPDRAPIIVAGIAIAECVMKRLGVNMLRVHDHGIREGLILEMIDALYPHAPASAPGIGGTRSDSIRRFAARCHYEQAHANHVADLALRIFDQLATLRAAPSDTWATPQARELLRYGAMLHDVGYLINYSRHNRHSYHLIRHADLPGFSTREVEIIANIARYHRKGEPRSTHPNFARLADPDRELVRRLIAISRLADGLARTHSQNIRDITLAIRGDTADFIIHAAHDPEVDIWGAQRKSAMFERLFDLAARFAWEPASHAASPDRGARDHHEPDRAAPPARRTQRRAKAHP